MTKTLIDCDIHNAVPAPTALYPYLSPRWRSYGEPFGFRGYPGLYPKGSPNAARLDAWPPSGGPPGSDLDFTREQLLDRYDVEYGILNCLHGPVQHRNDDYAAAIARAVNEWQAEYWLEKDPRLRASIVVGYENAELAAREIERAAEHPGFVQVLLLPRTKEPLGRRRYWPIYEAASAHDLPIGVHFGTNNPHPITSAGWPSYYIEDHTAMSVAFQGQVTSLIMEGVFERFRNLRIALIEGGFAWMPSLMWRLDGLHQRLGEEVPHLTKKPSEYVRDHMRLTTQPMEEPEQPRHLLDVIDMLGSKLLMFSTDYPHWDFDDPRRAFQIKLPSPIEQRIMHENARDFYNLS